MESGTRSGHAPLPLFEIDKISYPLSDQLNKLILISKRSLMKILTLNCEVYHEHGSSGTQFEQQKSVVFIPQ